jgi:hypothetical protein
MSDIPLDGKHYKTSLSQRLINRAYHNRFEFEVYNKAGAVIKVYSRRERAVMFCDNNAGCTFIKIEKVLT